MVRIAGVNIPSNKILGISLTYIYGIGRSLSEHVCTITQISWNTRVADLSDDQLVTLRNIIERDLLVEGALRKAVGLNIKRKKDMRSYQGLRHIKCLPVRGQRTHSNARTRKGKAGKSIAVGKKKVKGK